MLKPDPEFIRRTLRRSIPASVPWANDGRTTRPELTGDQEGLRHLRNLRGTRTMITSQPESQRNNGRRSLGRAAHHIIACSSHHPERVLALRISPCECVRNDPPRVPSPLRTVVAELAGCTSLNHKRERCAHARSLPVLIHGRNNMNRKFVLTGLAALALTAGAAPASAQGVSVGVGFGGGWYGDGYYGPGVSVGFGAPAWGYDNWGYGAYAAAPCTCATRFRSARYRSSVYASGGYPYDYDYGYASYPYNDYYYGGNYASVGFGWSDDDWRRRGFRDGRRFDRFSREDRFRTSNRETRFNDREIRGREDFRDRGRTSRAAVNGESRAMTRGGASVGAESRTMTRSGGEVRGGAGAEVRGGANTEFRGTNPADFSVRSGGEARGGAGAAARGGASSSGGRRGDNR